MENNNQSINIEWAQERQKLQNALVKYAANLKSAERENAGLRARLEELQDEIAQKGETPGISISAQDGKEEIVNILVEVKRLEKNIIKAAEEKAALIVENAHFSLSEISKAVEFVAMEIKISEGRVLSLFKEMNSQLNLLKEACGEKQRV